MPVIWKAMKGVAPAACLWVGLSLPAAAAAGGQAGAFLRQDATARGAAMAGAMTAATDDSASLHWNPAGLSRLAKPELGATRVQLFEDTAFDQLSAGLPTRVGGFAVSYLRQSSGGFERRAGPSDTPVTFSVSQTAMTGGWGARLPGLPIELGASFKSVTERIDQRSASATGADAGFIVRPRADVAIGGRVQNLLAPRPSFGGAADPYPRVLELSPAWSGRAGPEWRVLAAARLARVAGGSTQWGLGGELQYGRLAALRLGLREGSPTTGFGLRLGNLGVDYAAATGDLGVSHVFTITQRFGQTKEELEDTIRRGILKLSRGEGVRLARAYLQKADAEIRENRSFDALRSLEAASLLDPENADIKARIARLQAQWEEAHRRQTLERAANLARREQEAGNLLAARQYWRAVLELELGHHEAVLQLARIDQLLTAEERARLEGLRHAQSAGEVAAALAAAAALSTRGQPRLARLEAEKALRRFPANAEIAAFIKEARAQTEELVKARLESAAKKEAAKDYAGALADLEAAASVDPESAEAAERLAAVRALMARRLDPAQRRNAEQMYYRAVERYLKGDFKSADALADEVLKLDPGSASARTLKEKVAAALRVAP
jgi:hypothetical protein